MARKKKETKKLELEINKSDEKVLGVNETSEKVNDEEIPNKPSEEEILESKNKFDALREDFETKSWAIGDPEKNLDFYNYLTHFIKNRLFWTKNGWMGVIKLVEELEEAHKVATSINGPLRLGYQALEFTYYCLSNPAGIGLETAQVFESEYENFLELFKIVEEQLNSARDDLKKVHYAQEDWAAMAQGFYLEREDGVIDESQPEESKESSK